MDAVSFLRQADTHLFQVLSDGRGIEDFRRRIEQVRELVEKTGVSGLDSFQIWTNIQCVRDSAAFFLGIERISRQIADRSASEMSSALQNQALSAPETIVPADVTPSDSLNAQVLRRWFADNIVDPSPDTKTKHTLVARTNALPGGGVGGRAQKPIDYKQVMLWFINMRRRSGWTSFYKTFARKDKAKLERLVNTLRRQGQAPPPGVKDDIAALMAAWTVPMVSEEEDDEDDDEEEQQPKGRGNKGSKAKKAPASKSRRSNKPITIPLSSQNPALADPTGTLRAKACRSAYSKMMDFISAGAKERVGDWLDEVLEGVEEKPKIVKQTEAVSFSKGSSSSMSTERKIAALPSRTSKRQASSHFAFPEASTSGASIVELPSSSVSSFVPRKSARLPGSELGPRLPSTLASDTPLVPTNFWQSSLSSNSSSGSFIHSSIGSSLPTASMSLTLSMPFHGLNNGVPAPPRNASGQSTFSSITDISHSGQSTDSSVTTQSSQPSCAYFASGVGMGDSSLVRSACSSEASPIVGSESPTRQVSSPAGMKSRSACDDGMLESAPKRFRPGNRPRHTDGGAPTSITNLPMMTLHQTPFPVSTMNLNLSLSMNGQAGIIPFGAPQQNYYPGMSTTNVPMPQVPAMAAADLAAWYYQTVVQQNGHQMPGTALYNSAMPGTSAVGMRSTSGPERFMEHHGSSGSSFYGPGVP
ncbi:hypothetical protein A4X09_0g844 [Tilletia walkeri]|uniref:Uncharacterized protein n=1 Tax=Tilletia walkeri TaxID=117179 RepID=A0A8X7T791_9BASI|nr:hypothetical protein A4X09_0g844 [Tilletia walkeri]